MKLSLKLFLLATISFGTIVINAMDPKDSQTAAASVMPAVTATPDETTKKRAEQRAMASLSTSTVQVLQNNNSAKQQSDDIFTATLDTFMSADQALRPAKDPQSTFTDNNKKKQSEEELRNALILDTCSEQIKNLVKVFSNKKNLEDIFVPKRLLFVGLPGTGKSALAKAIAAACKLPVIPVDSTTLGTSWQNSNNENIKALFDSAAKLKQPCAIIIDDLQLLINSHEKDNKTEGNMLMALWQALDGNKNRPILFLGTFNHVRQIPAQITDRFPGKIIEIPMPNEQQRTKTITHYLNSLITQGYTLHSSINMAKLLKLTEGFTNRSIDGLFENSACCALIRGDPNKEVTWNDFEQEGQKIRLSEKTGVKNKPWYNKAMIFCLKNAIPITSLGLAGASLYVSIKSNNQQQQSFIQQNERYKTEVKARQDFEADQKQNAEHSKQNSNDSLALNIISTCVNVISAGSKCSVQ